MKKATKKDELAQALETHKLVTYLHAKSTGLPEIVCQELAVQAVWQDGFEIARKIEEKNKKNSK